MPGSESRADAMLSYEVWYMRCIRAGGRTEGKSHGLAAENDRLKGTSKVFGFCSRKGPLTKYMRSLKTHIPEWAKGVTEE